MMEGQCAIGAWNASLRYSESDILMEKCGRKEQSCDIRRFDDDQLITGENKYPPNAVSKYMSLNFKIKFQCSRNDESGAAGKQAPLSCGEVCRIHYMPLWSSTLSADGQPKSLRISIGMDSISRAACH
jgi:hypothetical protein